MSASWSLGDGPHLPFLCFVEIQWLHVHRIRIYGYGYGWEISYPRKPGPVSVTPGLTAAMLCY